MNFLRLLLTLLCITTVVDELCAAQEATAAAPQPSASENPAQTNEPAPEAADTAKEASARSAALELAGAFANDGYKIRDGFWFSALSKDEPVVLEVNLFAGNEYWFCVAGNEPIRGLDITVFNNEGQSVDQQDYVDGARTAAGVEPETSGKYLVQLKLVEGNSGTFGLVYCYK